MLQTLPNEKIRQFNDFFSLVKDKEDSEKIGILQSMAHLVGYHSVCNFLISPNMSFLTSGPFPGFDDDVEVVAYPVAPLMSRKEIGDVVRHMKEEIMDLGISIGDSSIFPDGCHQRVLSFDMDVSSKFRIYFFTAFPQNEEREVIVGGISFQVSGRNGFPPSSEWERNEDGSPSPHSVWTSFLKQGGIVHLFSIPQEFELGTVLASMRITKDIKGENGESLLEEEANVQEEIEALALPLEAIILEEVDGGDDG